MNLKDVRIPPIHLYISRFFGRFHVVAFTVVFLGGLAAITYVLNEVVTSSSESDSNTTISQEMPDFDQTTIERVTNLKQSAGEIKTLNFPSNQRKNPFIE